jgi:hypothetical protein
MLMEMTNRGPEELKKLPARYLSVISYRQDD